MQYENNDGIDNRDFARIQYNFLKEKNLGNRFQLSRIFKAAGPGQVQEAYKLATSEKWDAERKNLLLMIVVGSSRLKLERVDIENYLKKFNFYVPQAKNDNCFYRVLRGAGEMLSPGLHHFSNEDIQQIKDGLRKRIYEEDQVINDSDEVESW